MKKKIFTKDNLIFFLILNLGLIFTAVGISIFKTPNHFAFGGTSGLSIILSTLFPKWNVGAFMWIVNAALVVLGFFFLGIRSMGWTIYSSFALSFYVSACEVIYPLSFPLTHDVFLELCFAVILPAVGAAMVFNVGASTGGTDIVAMILHKYTSLEIGRALLVSDLGIVLIAAYLYGAQTGLYCILGMILKCTVVDSAIESLNLRKVCTIISKYPDQVEDFIINDLHRRAAVARQHFRRREPQRRHQPRPDGNDAVASRGPACGGQYGEFTGRSHHTWLDGASAMAE